MPPDVHLVVAAHPDDEAIGFAISLADLPAVHVAYLTHDDRSGERVDEGRRALALLGVPGQRVFALGATDQDSSHHMADLSVRLGELARRVGATVLVGHPYEGGHPDHDTAAFCTHAAAALAGAGALVEFASYHAGPASSWRRGAFLEPNRAVAGPCPATRARVLDAGERRLKRRVFACYASQADVLAPFPVDVELTREAPRYDFLAAPHDGPLLYERYEWGMTGSGWRALARQALGALGLDGKRPL
jgi:LmbE family N-acetylglucosaminyl deacetylase